MTFSALLALAVSPATPAALPGIDSIGRLDLLPTYRTGVRTAAITSYDRTEGNDDGFSGKYSFVRKEGDGLVLADLKGPGVITRFHTPTPTDEPLEFYFDGETKPRLVIPYREMFEGDTAPFLRPLVDAAGGGYVSYVPIPYAKSCKVVLRAPSTQFYDLNYATYPEGTKLESFDPSRATTDLKRADAVLSGERAKDLTAYNVPAGTKLTRKPFAATLAPGKSVTIFESKQPGRIASLRLSPDESFRGKARDILLRITWDDERTPAVLMPVGDFFGYAWGNPSMASALVGTADGQGYCNLPMPFAKAAKIELVSDRLGTPVPFKGEIVVGDTGKRPDEGRFYAVWRRENPTTEGKPFTWLDFQGRGHLVGLSVQAQGLEPGNTFFFEGDDKSMLDGEMAVHGTGSEDFFSGGWYDVPGRWDRAFSRDLTGCLAYQRYLSRTGGFRFLLNDAYTFERSIIQTIEHAPERNERMCDYAGVAYLYADHAPANPMPSRAERLVNDPVRIVYSAHWTMPIESFSLAGSTLTRGEIPVGKEQVRALSLRAQGDGDFDLCFVALRADLPSAGRYKVYADAIKGPEAGILQLFKAEKALGEPVDLYAEKADFAYGTPLGEFEAVEGGNTLMFRLIGKNASSKAMNLDLVNVVCVKL